MGLEHDNWRELDDDDPRTNDATGVEEHRRGYVPNKDDQSDVDIMNHEFTLSEIYCEYDMDGDGVPEKYVFYLGGTDYTYLHHEQIEGYCIAVVSLDPQPFTVIGRSLIDLTKQSTDNETAVLRTIVDNALIANNPRPAGDPTRVNFNDLMNNAIGAPIRTKGTPDIQYVDTPFTAQGLIPLLQYLEADAETRIGVTKAAQGLDPDAMQSTDKDAVRNTIALSQGQVELMVRNVVNTGLIPLFRIALRLATRHMDKRQTLIYKGAVVPVDIGRFDPELLAVPNVGLGTANQEMKLATLQFIYAEQKQYLMQMGMDNPFTSLSQIYNAIEDMAELGGITNLGRYFNYIDKDIEAVIARQMAQQAAAQAEEAAKNAPLDPAKALLMTEQIKARLKQMEILAEQRDSTLDRQLKALQEAEQLDFRRDDLAMERVIRLAEIGESRLNATIKREQDATSPSAPNSGSTGSTQQAS